MEMIDRVFKMIWFSMFFIETMENEDFYKTWLFSFDFRV